MAFPDLLKSESRNLQKRNISTIYEAMTSSITWGQLTNLNNQAAPLRRKRRHIWRIAELSQLAQQDT
jgi:hypothetical protein